jgi:F0F1-type ATP synthase membrane subunit b/b'
MIASMAIFAALMSVMFVGLVTNAWMEFQREIKLDQQSRERF